MSYFRSALVFAFLLAASFAVLWGCKKETSSTQGSIALAVTDAASDKLESFQVDLTGIVLRDGEGVETAILDRRVRVDIVSLRDVSEIFRMLNAEEGTYVGGTVTIDWSTASARIVGESSAATILNPAGGLLTGTSALLLTFPADSVTVKADTLKLFEFDFDLDRSVEVNTTANTVTVAPSLLLRIDRSDQKTLYCAGTLESAASSGFFTLSLKRPGGDEVGAVTCQAGTTSIFQVAGVTGTGSTGYGAMVNLGAGARVEVYGDLDRSGASILAYYVEAGIGTIGGGTAAIDGIVTARTGGPQAASPVLTVLGSTANSSGDATSFGTSYTVNLSLANTRVVRFGASAALTTNDVNVGQRVRVYGTLTGTTMAATTTSSVVRLWPTRIFGYANAAASGGFLGIDLRQVGLRPQGSVNWSVSGTVQAVPADFFLSIGDLPASTIVADSIVESLGFFPAVNAASADFTAMYLLDRTTTSLLRVNFAAASATALSSISATEVDIDVTGSALAVADKGFAGTTTIPSSSLLKLIPASSDTTFYTIWRDEALTTYADFAGFAADLSARKAGGAKVLSIRALGTYDSTGHTYQSALVTVVLD